VRRLAILAFLASLLFPAAVSAHTVYLFGQIGKSAVLAAIDRDENELSGWYLYLDVGKQLQLAGKIGATGDFQLDETVDGHKTGRFEGKAEGGRWSGEWRAPGGGAPLVFTLNESRDTLADFSGRFHCAKSKKDKGGWTYDLSLTLEMTKGAVKALEAGRSESSTQDDSQGCFYSLENFTRVPADVGVLLKAKDEDDPPTDDSQHCTIRILGDADHLFLRFGDAEEKNNDCRFSGDRAFCSPNSWMADVIVDRRTKSCKSVGD